MRSKKQGIKKDERVQRPADTKLLKGSNLKKQVGVINKERITKQENEQKYKQVVAAIASRAIVPAFDIVQI